ncbi:cytochrome P450 [Streptomyces iconiensis]|uniref:Cytochrome P450 n=1 Tax=Streptomyces iconiensis TaxID=1384038 RepID=A0ABT6ZUJ7_9ACTN|nr:cytochrome P450 [Streptomyces iconiensis]MDJ1132734.1 cytochrome P450 [Streptomyces iconiensis]
MGPREFDPWSREFIDDPFPAYAALREKHPVCWFEPTAQWLVSGYAEVQAALRNPALGRSQKHRAAFVERSERMRSFSAEEVGFWHKQFSVLDEDPPLQTRLRALLGPPFSAREWQRKRGRYVERARALAEPFVAAGGGDLVSALFQPLAWALVGEAVGVPEEDQPMLAGLSREMTEALVPNRTPEALVAAARADQEAVAYLLGLVRARENHPGDDLVSALAEAKRSGVLSEEECGFAAVTLFLGPFDSAAGTSTIGWLSLLRHPDQLQLLRNEPGRFRAAIEELLRYDSSVHMFERWALEDAVIGGVRIPRGSEVAVLFVSANRDDAYFHAPDELDLTRARGGTSHLAFGTGWHGCLGPVMGRVQMEAAYTALLAAAPHYRLVEEPRWGYGYNLRHPLSLLVEV